MPQKNTLILLCILLQSIAFAQQKLTIEDVRTVSLRNAGQIMDGQEIKGYFVFYVSDKVDKKTNAFTIDIMDANLNKVKDIQLEADKNTQLAECSYNNKSILFLFSNMKEKSVEHRVYNFDGKLIASYQKEFGEEMPVVGVPAVTEEAQNQNIFNAGDIGYTSIITTVDPKKFTYNYNINFFFSDSKKQWAYTGDTGGGYEVNSASYVGASDSVALYLVAKKDKMMSQDFKIFLMGLHLFTGKRLFELPVEDAKYKIFPTNVVQSSSGSQFILIGNYYNPGDNMIKAPSLGLSAWTFDNKGKLLSAKYNSWDSELGKAITADASGTTDDAGYIFLHKIVPLEDGRFYAVGEGYRTKVNGVKIKITDMMLIEFDDKFNITGNKVFRKNHNSVGVPFLTSIHSPHLLAMIARATGDFDYDFTTTDNNRTRFTVGYSDYIKEQGYKGMTFNTISYADNKFSTDKITLSSDAAWMKILPAKTGSVLIMEYFKKQKKLDMRLEKIN